MMHHRIHEGAILRRPNGRLILDFYTAICRHRAAGNAGCYFAATSECHVATDREWPLRGLDLSRLNLSFVDFGGADPTGCRLDGSRLAFTYFDAAVVEGATFDDAIASTPWRCAMAGALLDGCVARHSPPGWLLTDCHPRYPYSRAARLIVAEALLGEDAAAEMAALRCQP